MPRGRQRHNRRKGGSRTRTAARAFTCTILRAQLMRMNRMKLFKLLLAVAGATVLLGALVSTASATRLASSSQTLRAGFARVNFTGPFGTTECALTLEGSLHSRTITKTIGSLIGLITRAVLGACVRGSATI